MERLCDSKHPAVTSADEASEKEADRWLDVFSLLVHDLESPIVSVKYLLKLLEKNQYDVDNDRHQRLMKSATVAMKRAESIIYDIMEVARSQKAGIRVNMTTLVPDAVIAEAIELATGAAEENDIKITFRNNSGAVPVQADPKLLKRVIDNLLYNAIRHTPSGGTVAVYTEPQDKSVIIHIKDSGEGLGDVDSTQLFEKYGQLRLRAERKHRGVGLGLYFCRLAATGMGGTVLVDDHPKGGAVFSIQLKKTRG